MPLIKADRVKETTTSTGVSNIALAGAATGYRAFSAVMSVGDTCYYAIAHQTAGEWEVGLATYSAANTLQRTAVHASSNANAAVNFSAGTKECFISATKAWLDTFITQTSGTTNYVPKVTGTGTIGDSQIYDNGTSVGIGTASPSYRLQVDASSVDANIVANVTSGYGGIGVYAAGTNKVILGYVGSNTNYGSQTIAGDVALKTNGTNLHITTGAGNPATTAYFASGGNVGIGTSSPDSKLHAVGNIKAKFTTYHLSLTGDLPGYTAGAIPTLKSDATKIWFASNNNAIGSWGTDTSFQGIEVYAVGSGVGARINTVPGGVSYIADGNVGIGTTSPGAQLQVTTAAAATKGLIVKGASAQSANLQEWQNSAGSVLASIDSSGDLLIANGTATVSRDSVYTDYVGQLVLQGTTDTNKRLALGADTTNNIGFLQSYRNSLGPIPLIINPNNVGTGSNTVGVGNVTSPDGQLHVTTHVSNRKVLVARAHASQSVNIQEWQNSSGNTYAAVNNYFGAQFHGWSNDGPHGGVEQVCLSAGNKSFWSSGDAALMTIGFVDIAGVYDGTNWSMYFKTGSSGSRSERMRITHTGNVGIGTISPSTKLDVAGSITSNSTSGDRLIFKRSSDNATMTQIGTDGTAETYITSITQINLNNSGSGLRLSTYANWADSTAAENIWVKHSNLVFQQNALAPLNRTLLNTSYFQVTSANYNAIPAPTSRLEVYGDTRIESQAAATKALVVRGASGQSANLQEWQNNSGTALASVNSSGQFTADGFGGNYLYAPTAYTDYWRIRSFYRAAPTTVGNYIEICSIQEGSGYYEIYAASEYGAGIGTTVKKYSLPAAFGTLGIGTLTPKDMVRQSGYESTFDFELEIHRVAAYDARLRLRRTAGTSARYVTITVQQHFLNTTDIISLTGTGTSTYGGFNQIAYINPWNYSPPVPGGSGSGNGIAFYATSASSSGSGGDITVVPGASAGGNQLSNSDGCFVIGNMSTGNLKHWYASRNLPATQGDYVEICLLTDGNPAWFEVDLIAYQFAGTRCVRRYRFQDLYATSCVVEPYYETTTSVSGNPSGIVELEYVYTGTPGQFALRLRRTAATGSAIPCYVNVRYAASFRQNIVGISGTGTSSVGSSLLGQSVVSPTTIQPRAPVGNSGSGLSLTIQGGNAAGTGNGGNILLQAGAYATSGSNGKVIVRGLASNTANLQEWQNNAGTTLAYVSSDASVIGTPSTCYIGANDNSGGQIALYGYALGYGVGIRQTSLGGDVALFKSGQISFYAGQGGNNAAFIMTGNVNASGSVATFVNSGDVGSRVIIAKGKASQTGNLQEWQNSSGTALASVSANGSLVTSGSISLASGLKTTYTKEYDYLRAAPTTVGDYVEICSYFSWSHCLEITAVSEAGIGIGTTVKRYILNSVYGMWNFTLAPIEISRQGGYESTFDFELEVALIDSYNVALRLRRTAGTSARNVLITVKSTSVYQHDQTPLSGTGTSTISLTNVNGTYINPYNYALPVAGTSGNGNNIGLYAGSAVGTGSGGNILLQAGAFSTSGSNGKVIVRGLASNTANLQEWQNNAGSVLSAVNSAGDFTNTGGYSYTEKFGNAASVTNSYATAIGYAPTAGQLSTAVGAFAVASGVTSTAVGADANAAGSGGTALGRSANAAAGAVAVGFNASASGNNGIAVGRSAIAGTGTAIGYNFTGSGVGYTSFCASTDGRFATGAIDVFAGDGVNTNTNISRQHSILGTWSVATYASRLGRVQLRVNDYTTDREAIRYESDGANALTSIGGASVIASTTLAVQPAVSGNKGIVVKGASGQSASLLELQNSSGQVGFSVSVNQYGEATLANGPRYISTAPEFQAGLYLQYLDSTIDRLNVKMHGSASIGFATLSAQNTSLDTYVSRGGAGVLRVNAASGAGGSIAITSNTPSAFTADQNNLALTASGFQRLSGTAARTITGIAPPSGASHVDGRMMRIYNVGSHNLTLKHNSTSSTAANRFWNVQAIDIIVGPNDYAELIYDGTNNGSGAAGWRVA